MLPCSSGSYTLDIIRCDETRNSSEIPKQGAVLGEERESSKL